MSPSFVLRLLRKSPSESVYTPFRNRVYIQQQQYKGIPESTQRRPMTALAAARAQVGGRGGARGRRRDPISHAALRRNRRPVLRKGHRRGSGARRKVRDIG